jgi:hypothetical protein
MHVSSSSYDMHVSSSFTDVEAATVSPVVGDTQVLVGKKEGLDPASSRVSMSVMIGYSGTSVGHCLAQTLSPRVPLAILLLTCILLLTYILLLTDSLPPPACLWRGGVCPC